MSLRTPVELGIAAYMGGYYKSLGADTDSMREFVTRGLARSIVWAPGRLVDAVEDMLKEWRMNDNTGKPGVSSMMPVIFVALDKNFLPVTADYGIATPTMDFAFPDDPLNRNYKVRLSTNEYRAQIVFAAPEQATAHSLALQFNMWANQGPAGRRFGCPYDFAGFSEDFPAVLETPDIGAVNHDTDQKIATILVADMTIRATVPIFTAPLAGEPNDGKAAPAGYPVVTGVNTSAHVLQDARDTLGNGIQSVFATSTTSIDINGNITVVRE